MHTFLDERDRLEIDNRIKKASSKSIVVGKAGSVVNVTDGANDVLKGLRVFGKTEQKTVPGNQLLNIDGNFIVNSDGTIQKNSSCYSATIKVENANNIYISGDFTLLNSGTVRVGLLNEEPTEQSVSVRASATASSSINVSGYSYVLISFSVHGLDTTVEQIKNSFMVNKGMTALPWEPYVGGIPSPNPEYPQELVSAGGDGNVEVGVYGGNLFDANALVMNSNKTLDVSDDGYTIVCTGGSDNSYRFSYLYLDVNALIGKTIYLTADSILSNSIRGVQLIVYYDNDNTKYYPIEKDVGMVSSYVNEHVTRIAVCIYSNNTSTALDTDNTITVKGLRLTLEENSSWTPCKQKQTLTIPTPNGLPTVPVTDASLATYIDENGQMYCADEIDYERGVYIQRVGVEVLTTLSMNEETSDYPGRFVRFLTLQNRYLNGTNPVVSNKFYFGGWGLATNNKWIISLSNSMLYIAPPKGSGYTVDALNVCLAENISADNPLIIAAILETPIETPLSEEEIAAYKALHTNYPNTTILNDSNAHMEVKYTADIKNHIEQNYVSKEDVGALLSRVSNIEKNMV